MCKITPLSNDSLHMYPIFKKLSISTLIALSCNISAEEPYKVGIIDVYTNTPLPSIGLPINMVPSSIQTVNGQQISEQAGVSVADYMVNNLQGVTVNEVGGNPYQLEINFRGYNATPISGNPQGLSVYVVQNLTSIFNFTTVKTP